MTTNPFSFGNAINDPSRFCNRKHELRQIVNRLLSSAHESTSIVGERRMGKTSLLKYLANPKVAPDLGIPPDQYCFIYVDFQGLTKITPEQFWNRVLEKMSKSICKPELAQEIENVRKQSSLDLFDLEDLLEKIIQSGLNIVLMMDEFEAITQNEAFGPEFFGGLRTLAIHSGLTLITATQNELVDLCYSDDLKSSPFFNIFASVILRPFTREETYTLVESYLRTIDFIFTPEEKEFAVNLGGGHPFFTQIAGHYLVENRIQGNTGPQLFDKVEKDFLAQAVQHFKYFWFRCNESEKVTLLAVIGLVRQKNQKNSVTPTINQLVKIRPKSASDISNLIKRGVLAEENGCLRLLPPGFEQWIIQEISAESGEEGSEATIQGWLKSNGGNIVKVPPKELMKFKKEYWSAIVTFFREVSIDVVGMSIFEVVVKSLMHLR
jgi:AAA+ ATPase superfamily predicted ATPase